MVSVNAHTGLVRRSFRNGIHRILDGLRRVSKNRVLVVQINKESIERLDELKEAGAVRSRSEAAAYFMLQGIKARQDLIGWEDQNISVPETIHSETTEPTRTPNGQWVPQKDYEFPILETLYELKGSGRSSEVLERVHRKMEHRLQDADYELVGNGKEARWHNLASWARKALIERGLLKSDSEWGVWELTGLGKAAVTGEDIWCF